MSESATQFDNLSTLGDLMAEYPISFTGLSEATKISRSALEDIVYGNTKNPQPDTMREIAKFLGREPRQIREFAIAIEARKQRLGKDLPVKDEASTGRTASTGIPAPLLASL